jgi:poly-gamma-glutamate synthesis protein (capsule biosynthesis protein)
VRSVAPVSVAPAPPDPAPKPRPSRLVIVAGGDVSLGRGVGKKLLSDIEYDPLRGVSAWISTADVAFVNLESPLADRNGETERPGERNVFTGPPVGAGILARSGIDIVSVANNHAWDYGRSGFFETLDYLTMAGVAYAGGNVRPGEQYQATVIEAQGYKVAVFAVTDTWNPAPFEKHEGSQYVARADWSKLESEMIRARRDNDVVLVSYHGGREYDDQPTVDTIAFARTVLRHGADAFIGHHPHVPQGVGWVKGKPALFSLGNLVFGVVRDQPGTGWAFLAKLTFEAGALSSVRLCPFHITARSLPEMATGAERTGRAQELIAMSTRVGGTVIGEADEEGCFGVSPPR